MNIFKLFNLSEIDIIINEIIKIINELKEVKRKIKKEKYHNAMILINLAKEFGDNINCFIISLNENISEANLR